MEPRYRLLTGPDDERFCARVARALDDGYVLYGSPSITFNSHREECIVAQAVIIPDNVSEPVEK